MFVPLDFLNAVVYPSISKPIEEVWDGMVIDAVEGAKDNGLKGIYNLINATWFNKDNYGDYKCIKIGQNALNELIRGDIKTLKEMQHLETILKETMDKYEYEDTLLYTIFHYTKTDKNTDKEITYVDAIFIN